MGNQSLKYHQNIAEYFNSKPLYLDEPTQKKPNNRKLLEQPWQQTKAALVETKTDLWEPVIETLCDLYFIEAKCVAGLTFTLINDYLYALNYLPENLLKTNFEKSQNTRVNQWTQEIIEYSNICNNQIDLQNRDEIKVMPKLPEPLFSCRFKNIKEKNAYRKQIIKKPDRKDKLIAFEGFVSSQCYILIENCHWKGFLPQHAYGYNPAGFVHDAAAAILTSLEVPHLVRHWSSTAFYNSKPVLLKSFEGHDSTIWRVATTPNGRLAVSAGGDTLKVWDISSGQCLKTIILETRENFSSIRVTPDGRWVISAISKLLTDQEFLDSKNGRRDSSLDHTIRVWNLETGQSTQILKGHYLQARVDLTPDGGYAISGSYDKTIRIWDLTAGQCLRTIDGHTEAVTCVRITPNRQLAVSGSYDKTIRVWDPESGKCLHILEGHSNRIDSIDITNDGRLAVSASADYTLRVWNIVNGKCLSILKGHTGVVSCVSITMDGKYAISGSYDYSIRIWNLENGKCIDVIKEQDSIHCLSVILDGRNVVGSYNKVLQIWDIENGQSNPSTDGLDNSFEFFSPDILHITNDGSRAISTGRWHKDLRIWNLVNGEYLRTIRTTTKEIRDVSISQDGQWAAIIVTKDEALYIWDIKLGKCLRVINGLVHDSSCCITNDGQLAVTGGLPSTIYVWNLKSGECIFNLYGHHAGTAKLVISPNGDRVLSIGNYNVNNKDFSINQYDLKTGSCLPTLKGHSDIIVKLIVTQDSQHAISLSTDKTLRIWNLETGSCLHVFGTDTNEITCFNVLTDNKRIILGSLKTTLQIYDLYSGECLSTIKGKNSEIVNRILVTKDDQLAITAIGNRTIKIWDIERKVIVAQYAVSSQITSIAISPTTPLILCGIKSGEVIILELRGIKFQQPMSSIAGFVRLNNINKKWWKFWKS